MRLRSMPLRSSLALPAAAVCSDTSIIRSNVAETKLKMPDYREVSGALSPSHLLI